MSELNYDIGERGDEGPLWNSAAIFIAWDDWGGFYDHVAPPQVNQPVSGSASPG